MINANFRFGTLRYPLIIYTLVYSSLYFYHFSTVIDFSSEKYSGSTV